ncbi:MAG: orotidine-5'-phosphate decarboxylase [Candidatus Eremiobacteraeota bacterium]|nr:orotidine-5'-phosphate decarboxylase [Candidatus Eremiobacteraeota bacterium]
MNYLDVLKKSAQETSSIVCIGLDPVIEAMPAHLASEGIAGVPEFYRALFDRMAQVGSRPGAFKLNHGFYLKYDTPLEGSFRGSHVMAQVIGEIRKRFPGIPLILDYKRGDITTSSANYADEGFLSWGVDAVTVSPFMGSDSILPFAEYCNDEKGRGVYLLNRNSNKGALDFQNLMVLEGEHKVPLYIAIAEKIVKWAKERPGVGAVVGATSPEELTDIAKLYVNRHIPLLIPGVGAQGGSAGDVARRLRNVGYDLSMVRISSSSGITHPWQRARKKVPSNWPEVSVAELVTLNDEIAFRQVG